MITILCYPQRPLRHIKGSGVSPLDSSVIGETAAVVTSGLWTISSLFFTAAGRRIGSLNVNAYRTVMALGFLVVTHLVFLGTILPLASGGQWLWMGASGIVGLGIGDSGLFAAYVIIGPRRSLLMMALAPIFAATGGYVMLGETLPTPAVVGIALTLGGVVLVILEREENSGEPVVSGRSKKYGVFCALIAAFGQGVGLVLAKKGIELNPIATLNPLSATLMRMILGAISLWLLMLGTGKLAALRRAFNSKEGMRDTAAAAFVGPFLGVTLSMVAVTYSETGIAQTLLSLMPVMIIPVVWVLYRQKTSWQGIFGAIIAVIGVAILFIV
jgi:drug/metabolite transporter (DMT)-like permease